MSSEELENFENHLAEAEKYIGEDFYIVADHYRAAKNIAKNREIDEIKRRRFENLREEALEESLSDIEESIEELEDGPYRRDIMRNLWETLNETERFVGEDGMPEKYHELREHIAEDAYQEIFENSIGIINGEISILDNPRSLDEDLLLAERARVATENAKAAEEMVDYLGEENLADSPYFDHNEVLDSMDRMAVNLANHMDIAETRAAFENLAVLTEIYGVVNSLVDEGLKTKAQLNRMNFDVRNLEDKKYELEEAVENSVGIGDELHKLEFMISKVRRNIESIELPDEQEDELRERIQEVERTADDYWALEVE